MNKTVYCIVSLLSLFASFVLFNFNVNIESSIILAVSIFATITSFLLTDESEEIGQVKEFDKKIKQLKEVETKLYDSIQFITKQKVVLEETKLELVNLESRHSELSEIVSTEQKRVNTIINEIEKRNKSSYLLKHLISFCLGIITSIIGTLVLEYFK